MLIFGAGPVRFRFSAICFYYFIVICDYKQAFLREFDEKKGKIFWKAAFYKKRRSEKRGEIGLKTENKWALLGGGSAIGICNGLLGGGGGMLAVPLLRAAGKPQRQAHATAIAVILPASAVSGTVYLLHGLCPLPLLAPVALGVAAGGYFGAKLLASLPARLVSVVFGLLMLLAGARMLF